MRARVLMRASQTHGRTGQPRRGRAGERGNTMVETALIFIPMLAMFFGVVDVSMVVFLQNTLMNATREGTRVAITFSPTYNSTSCTASQSTCITSVVQTNAFGFLAGTNS